MRVLYWPWADFTVAVCHDRAWVPGLMPMGATNTLTSTLMNNSYKWSAVRVVCATAGKDCILRRLLAVAYASYNLYSRPAVNDTLPLRPGRRGISLCPTSRAGYAGSQQDVLRALGTPATSATPMTPARARKNVRDGTGGESSLITHHPVIIERRVKNTNHNARPRTVDRLSRAGSA